MFEFPVLNDEEINKLSGRLTEGPGQFKIEQWEIKYAKSSGNKQLVITLKVTDKNKTEASLIDFFPAIESCAWKLKSLFESLGKMELYKKGTLSEEELKSLQGCAGKCYIGKKTYVDNWDGLEKEQSIISRYLSPNFKIKEESFIFKACNNEKATNAEVATDADIDDAVPF